MLTKKQKQTYEFIKSYVQETGESPTMIEIAEGIGIKSKGTAHRYVQNLVDAKLIDREENGCWRNIRVLELANDKCIPLMGKIAAGKPIEAIEDQEAIDLSRLFGPKRYALKICGNSMIDEGIHDGDVVICEPCRTAPNGSIVVALIDNNCATLKRFRNNNDGTVTLIPANADFLPANYPVDRVAIQGVFVGLLRLAS